jgi:hypothetical protein
MELWNDYSEKLPRYLDKEVLAFLIPPVSEITFVKHQKTNYNSYSSRYDIAYFRNKIIKNTEGLYLSRIAKPNGKHRYYITEDDIDVMEVEHNDRMYDIYYYDYRSHYVGKDLEHALLRLMTTQSFRDL